MATDIEINSADYNINAHLTVPKGLTVIDLDLLTKNFKLDVIEKDNSFFISPTSKTNFVQIKYNKKTKQEPEEVYNRPPIGPIKEGFSCMFCFKTGPANHTVECISPSIESLRLTYSGFMNIIGDLDIKTNIEDIDILRRNADARKQFIVENFETPNPSPDDRSMLSYTEVVPIKGIDKLPFRTAKSSFSNVVFITYTNENNKNVNQIENNSNIRIYPSGFIDIKGAPLDENEMNSMVNELTKRILNTNSINLQNFNRLLTVNNIPKQPPLKINQNSFYTVIRAQFYLFGGKQTEQIADLEKLNSEVTKKWTSTNNFKLIETKLTTDMVSRTGNKIKDSLIYKFEVPTGTITLQVSRFGTFQFTISNSEQMSRKQNLDNLNRIKNFFVGLERQEFTEENLETKVKIYDKTETTVSGLVPPKTISQKQGTEVCPKNMGGVPVRPEPYTWTGKCPVDGYYVPPSGKQGGDLTETIRGKQQQLYYPCCKKLSAAERKKYEFYLKNGFPGDDADELGIFENHDALSGVFEKEVKVGDILYAKKSGSSWENPEWNKVEILATNKGKPISYKAKVINTNEVIKVLRTDLRRATRRFKGLNSLTKTQLIDILKNNNIIVPKREKYTGDLTNYFVNIKKLHQYTIVNDFTKEKYVVAGIPGNYEPCYIITENNKQFIIDADGYIIKETNYKLKYNNFNIFGYYDGIIFRAISIIGEPTSKKINTLIDDNRIMIVKFYDNIISETNSLLKKEPDTRLIFAPKNKQLDTIYYFKDNSIPEELSVQILDADKSRLLFGYKDIPFSDKYYYVDNIPQLKKIKPSVGDYIIIKPNYNNITKEIMVQRPFAYYGAKNVDKTMEFDYAKNIFEEVLNPITIEDFDNSEIWEFDDRTFVYENGKFEEEEEEED